ncbi:MAG TPA: hypothetical protein VGB56_14460 [Flavisolibacter sp.]
MKEVLLKFSTLLSLVDFTLATDMTKCEIDRVQLTISCRLSDAELELAVNGYGATIVESRTV